METFEDSLWVEKYRPPSLKQVLLPDQFMPYFKKIVDGEVALPNLLLYSSSPGSGKTSIAKALCKDLNADYLYINISDENGVDVLRDKIRKFASTISATGGIKVVIMDEFDGSSPALQKAMRASIEEFSKFCRFIFTANYIHKIIPAIQSRCQRFDFNMHTKEFMGEMIPKIVKRMKSILKREGYEYQEGVIEDLVETYYPDNRDVIQMLQQECIMMGDVTDNIMKMQQVDTELWDAIIKKDYKNSWKIINENGYDHSTIYTAMFKGLVPLVPAKVRSEMIKTIEYYMNNASTSTDPSIQLSACLVTMMEILNRAQQQET